MVLRIFLRVIAQGLQSNSPGAANADKAALHIGAVAFIHRFGSSLNVHVHFLVCVVDGVFEEVAGDADVQAAAPGVVFHPASGIDGIPCSKCRPLCADASCAPLSVGVCGRVSRPRKCWATATVASR